MQEVMLQYRRHLEAESRPVNGAARDLGAFEAR
jgi:hypothetical protein